MFDSPSMKQVAIAVLTVVLIISFVLWCGWKLNVFAEYNNPNVGNNPETAEEKRECKGEKFSVAKDNDEDGKEETGSWSISDSSSLYLSLFYSHSFESSSITDENEYFKPNISISNLEWLSDETSHYSETHESNLSDSFDSCSTDVC